MESKDTFFPNNVRNRIVSCLCCLFVCLENMYKSYIVGVHVDDQYNTKMGFILSALWATKYLWKRCGGG